MGFLEGGLATEEGSLRLRPYTKQTGGSRRERIQATT
jgi:hypothetical protein